MFMYPYIVPYMRQNYSITINTTNRTLSLYKDGEFIKYYPVGVGKPTDLIPT